MADFVATFPLWPCQVRGLVSQQEALIDLAIGTDASATQSFRMQAEGQPHCQNPRPAQTTLVRLEHGLYDGQPATKLLLIPYTGDVPSTLALLSE